MESEWMNMGDVDFLSYGGCLVKKQFSEEEISEFPNLNRCYSVLYVNTEAGENGDDIFAALHNIDLDDYSSQEWKENILYAIGAEDKKDLPMEDIMPDIQWAKEIVEYGDGTQPVSYKMPYPSEYQDYVLTEDELTDWIHLLGADNIL